MSSVEKNLIALEDIATGTGMVVQDRAGIQYVLHRIDLVPSVETVADLESITTYDRAKVGLVNYIRVNDVWQVDPIPLAALGSGLGSAAGRNTTGAGDLIAKGFAGIGGSAITSLAGAGIGIKASYVDTIAAGGPADEPTVVLTLPGIGSDAARLAVTLTNTALWFQKIGFAWTKVVVGGTDVEFGALKANSVRANSVGTPKG